MTARWGGHGCSLSRCAHSSADSGRSAVLMTSSGRSGVSASSCSVTRSGRKGATQPSPGGDVMKPLRNASRSRAVASRRLGIASSALLSPARLDGTTRLATVIAWIVVRSPSVSLRVFQRLRSRPRARSSTFSRGVSVVLASVLSAPTGVSSPSTASSACICTSRGFAKSPDDGGGAGILVGGR